MYVVVSVSQEPRIVSGTRRKTTNRYNNVQKPNEDISSGGTARRPVISLNTKWLEAQGLDVMSIFKVKSPEGVGPSLLGKQVGPASEQM